MLNQEQETQSKRASLSQKSILNVGEQQMDAITGGVDIMDIERGAVNLIAKRKRTRSEAGLPIDYNKVIKVRIQEAPILPPR